MKPTSIINFQRLFLASTSLTVLNTVVHYGPLRDFAIAKGASPAGPIVGILLTVGFYLLFRIAIGKIANNIAKWLFVAFTMFSFVEVPSNISKTMGIGASYALIDAICFLLQLLAAITLFQKDSLLWLKGARPPAQSGKV